MPSTLPARALPLLLGAAILPISAVALRAQQPESAASPLAPRPAVAAAPWRADLATADFDVGLDSSVHHGGRASVRFRATTRDPAGFAARNLVIQLYNETENSACAQKRKGPPP